MQTDSTHQPKSDKRATVKVCLSEKCRTRGADDIVHALRDGLSPEEAFVRGVSECFGHCKAGPNIAVNDNIMKGVRPFSVVDHVRRELGNPSCKADGLGCRRLEDLDSVLENIEKL